MHLINMPTCTIGGIERVKEYFNNY